MNGAVAIRRHRKRPSVNSCGVTFFSVKAGLLQHFVGFLIEGNDAVLVEQSFKLEQFRVLLVKIPGG